MIAAPSGEPVEPVAGRALSRPIRTIDRNDLISADAESRIRDVAALMARRGVGAVVVHRSHADPGVLSERDIVRAVAAGLDLDAMTSGDLVHAGMVTVDASDDIATAIDRLLTERARHTAVVGGDAIVLPLSMRDLLAS